LDGGDMQGFAIPAGLLEEIPRYLALGGVVLMELGAWQGRLAYQTAASVFPTARIKIHQDLAGHDRVLAIET
jgi:methylase of polypeptide subunit release factors